MRGKCFAVFLMLFVASGFAVDSTALEQCCKAKSVGGINYILSRVLTGKDPTDKLGCLNGCVYKQKGHEDTEYCFSAGNKQPMCIELSDNYVKFDNISKTMFQGLPTALTDIIDELENITQYTTAQGKLKYLEDLLSQKLGVTIVLGKNTTGTSLMDDALAKYTKTSPGKVQIEIAHNLEAFVDNMDVLLSNMDHPNDAIAILNSETEALKDINNEPFGLKTRLMALQAGISTIRFFTNSTDGKGGIDGGMEKMINALVKHTSSNLTWEMLNRRRCTGSDCVKSITIATVGGAVGGTLVGPEGTAVGAAVGATVGVAECAVGCIYDGLFAEPLGCFSGGSIIETNLGPKKMSDLIIGDTILTLRNDQPFHTKFVGWMDRSSSSSTQMIQVKTLKNTTITLTPSHVIFSDSIPRYAGDLIPGDSLMYWNGEVLEKTNIVEILPIPTTSYWAPLTSEGTLLVDGYLASCYASFPHEVSEIVFAPIKLMSTFILDDVDSQHKDGTRQVVKMIKKMGEIFGLRSNKKKTCTNIDDLLLSSIIPFNVETNIEFDG